MVDITGGVQPAEEELFTLITKQWGEYSEAKIEQLIDKRFIPLMKRINADPGMLTVQKWDDLFNKFIFGQLVRISTSTKYEERQVIDLAYGNLSHPNIQFTLEDD